MKYLFNTFDGRFKPTAQQVSDALFKQKDFLDNAINDLAKGSNASHIGGVQAKEEGIIGFFDSPNYTN